MRKVAHSLVVLSLLILAATVAWIVLTAPKAHADYFNYPCTYPFVGTGAEVDALVHAGGQYCDGPTEINGTHYHCMSGGGTVAGGGIALAPISGFTFGALGAGGVGGSGGDCHYVCPDLFRPPNGFPNPPAAWVKPLTVTPQNNICRDHMDPAGPDGAPVPPAQGDSPPAVHGQLPSRPPSAAGPLPPPGAPAVTVPDEGSPLTPGGVLPLP